MSIGVAADMELDRIVFDGLPPMCECKPEPGEVHDRKDCPYCGKPLPDVDEDGGV